MRKFFRFLLWLAACSVLLFAGIHLAAYIRQSSQSSRLHKDLAEAVVAVKETAARSDAPETMPQQYLDERQRPLETPPIAVDFAALQQTNQDVAGWLYSEDTPINLPLVQGKDNAYYLRRLFDGSWNAAGTLFLDFRNAGDFSDGNTILYGHNMKDKSMFGTLSNYKEQSYFDEHPVMWLLTPHGNYKVELIAGCVTTAGSRLYSFGQTEEALLALVEQAMAQSTFRSDFAVTQGDRFLTLSTCSYEYDDARYVVIGRLIPM